LIYLQLFFYCHLFFSTGVGIPGTESNSSLNLSLIACSALCHPAFVCGDVRDAKDWADAEDMRDYGPDCGNTFINSSPRSSPQLPSNDGLSGLFVGGREMHGMGYPEDTCHGDDESDGTLFLDLVFEILVEVEFVLLVLELVSGVLAVDFVFEVSGFQTYFVEFVVVVLHLGQDRHNKLLGQMQFRVFCEYGVLISSGY
jgi:hypothetical protein